MSRGLETVKDIKCKLSELGFVLRHNNQEKAPYIQETKWDIIEKELKALEIIKKKNVSVKELKKANRLTDYNIWYLRDNHDNYLSEEAFNLLKEVLFD